eukprot:CAMPEP_0175917916 /NCGR_PEP_ID=MMETSP0108-20121206/11611_1 /TAXON_ID=195067 ORGANISM="Goniomonas pacifica, Strain CCMP1869" /NCGR_SAMPLE_ID=MMETSP0108 /ASSEMBLY_ACC=CAM_ASM_000204 /LENGTH=396 /DNA_ID=CAMNT_0017240519 /DNA_START=4 /DNA_END=1194 /DNA_ORIENTATION=+
MAHPCSSENGRRSPRGTDEEEAEKESEHFRKIVDSFRYYKRHALEKIRNQEANWLKIPKAHQDMLPGHRSKFDAMRRAVQNNYEFILTILRETENCFQPPPEMDEAEGESSVRPDFRVRVTDPDDSGEVIGGSPMDMEKVQCTLRQFVRDWSEEGASERKQCYAPIVDTLRAYFAACPEEQRHQLRVLVPGAGLGRLVYDIASAGFSAQGNEFSYHMLLASNYALNHCGQADKHRIQPWVHQIMNVWRGDDQLRTCQVPDIPIGHLPPGVDFSMTAGDFLEVYAQDTESWDAVVTCFFLDTAHNVLAYLELISSILRPGGLLINLGPLLYHWSDLPDEDSIELSYEELEAVLPKFGFKMLRNETRTSYYTCNRLSMSKLQYHCAFFTAVKLPPGHK